MPHPWHDGAKDRTARSHRAAILAPRGRLDVRRLVFIRRARELGFTLDEVRALLRLSEADHGTTCADARELAACHLAEVKTKLADLQAMERTFAEDVRRCDAGEVPGCPLIDALSSGA